MTDELIKIAMSIAKNSLYGKPNTDNHLLELDKQISDKAIKDMKIEKRLYTNGHLDHIPACFKTKK